MSDYQPTIGLEIHAELKTRTKMFCDSLNDPEEKHPNVNVCPVCLAHPGTLPTINKAAVESVIKVGLALGGNINPKTKFDRKNYFYPDLPKGYQISQYDEPLVSGGELKGARIRRVHLEEDTGTLIHSEEGPSAGSGRRASLVDFNRAGVPLMELVTEPDLASADDAVALARELQLILRYLGVSDANMEKGQMRIEANVSVKKTEDKELGTKVELKNINSFKAAKAAIEYELKRQEEALIKGEKVHQETRGWNEAKQKTVSQRSKEEAHDYRYFPEPDLPPFETGVFGLDNLRSSLPEMPQAKRERFKKESKDNKYELDEKQIEVLVSEPRIAQYYEELVSKIKELCTQSNPRPADPQYPTFAEFPNFLHNVMGRGFKYLTENLQDYIKSNDLVAESIYEKFPPDQLASFVYHVEFGLPGFHGNNIEGVQNVEKIFKLLIEHKLSNAQIRTIFRNMLEQGVLEREELMKILESGKFVTISDDSELELAVSEIVAEHPGPVADYKKGKKQALQFLIGQTMARLKGKGDPQKLAELIERTIRSGE